MKRSRSQRSRVAVSILVPTHNEELHIGACLASVAEWADEIFVVDSFSTDRTLRIAKFFGAHCLQHPFEGHAAQKNWALDNCPFSNEWVLILDADERVSPELAEEIRHRIADDGSGCNGFYLNRRLMFYGRWMRHSGWYPIWNLRLFRHRLGRYENRFVDEHLVIQGRAGHCDNDLIHEDIRDMEFWIAKHNRYSNLNAQAYRDILRGEGSAGLRPKLFGNQAERKRFIKERIWPHLPGRALLYFFYLYVFRLGFLDGKQGFVFCMMHAIFEEFNTVKLWELLYYKVGAPSGAVVVPRSNSLEPLGVRADCDKCTIPAETEVEIESSPSSNGNK